MTLGIYMFGTWILDWCVSGVYKYRLNLINFSDEITLSDFKKVRRSWPNGDLYDSKNK